MNGNHALMNASSNRRIIELTQILSLNAQMTDAWTNAELTWNCAVEQRVKTENVACIFQTQVRWVCTAVSTYGNVVHEMWNPGWALKTILNYKDKEGVAMDRYSQAVPRSGARLIGCLGNRRLRLKGHPDRWPAALMSPRGRSPARTRLASRALVASRPSPAAQAHHAKQEKSPTEWPRPNNSQGHLACTHKGGLEAHNGPS